jgi:hypothetical protein
LPSWRRDAFHGQPSTQWGREMHTKILDQSDKARLARIGETGPDALITLKEACETLFAGAISVATLRVEHQRGNLVISKIGRQYFTTLRDIEDMRTKCVVAPPVRFVPPVRQGFELSPSMRQEVARLAFRSDAEIKRDNEARARAKLISRKERANERAKSKGLVSQEANAPGGLATADNGWTPETQLEAGMAILQGGTKRYRDGYKNRTKRSRGA